MVTPPSGSTTTTGGGWQLASVGGGSRWEGRCYADRYTSGAGMHRHCTILQLTAPQHACAAMRPSAGTWGRVRTVSGGHALRIRSLLGGPAAGAVATRLVCDADHDGVGEHGSSQGNDDDGWVGGEQGKLGG